jgi:hypothetical protein
VSALDLKAPVDKLVLILYNTSFFNEVGKSVML